MTDTKKKRGNKNLKVVKGGKSNSKSKAKKKKTFDEAAFCKKYPHVVKGTVKEVPKNSVIDGTKAVHGRVCKIKCTERGCEKLRTINVQDAWQVKFCVAHQKARARTKAAKNRKSKKKTA
jgi:hypothetical protein